jgi:predicted phosphoribosyltransferase
MTELLEKKELRNKVAVFADRPEAGRLLGNLLKGNRKIAKPLVLAIPSGGVPIGCEIATILHCDLELLIVRKAQLPWDTEAGFGAVNLDGDVILNERLVRSLSLSSQDIETQIEKTELSLRQRNNTFRQNREFPEISHHSVIIADDGLASGFTMKAALQYVVKRQPLKIIVAVPTASALTIAELPREVDLLACLNVREGYPYAVAAAYRNWHDLQTAEVLEWLSKTLNK